MNRRNGFVWDRRRRGAACSSRRPGMVPAWVLPPEPDWLARERAFIELVTRYARLAAWLAALSAAVLFLSITASVAAHHFGIASALGVSSPAGAPELFTRQPRRDFRLDEHP